MAAPTPVTPAVTPPVAAPALVAAPVAAPAPAGVGQSPSTITPAPAAEKKGIWTRFVDYFRNCWPFSIFFGKKEETTPTPGVGTSTGTAATAGTQPPAAPLTPDDLDRRTAAELMQEYAAGRPADTALATILGKVAGMKNPLIVAILIRDLLRDRPNCGVPHILAILDKFAGKADLYEQVKIAQHADAAQRTREGVAIFEENPRSATSMAGVNGLIRKLEADADQRVISARDSALNTARDVSTPSFEAAATDLSRITDPVRRWNELLKQMESADTTPNAVKASFEKLSQADRSDFYDRVQAAHHAHVGALNAQANLNHQMMGGAGAVPNLRQQQTGEEFAKARPTSNICKEVVRAKLAELRAAQPAVI